MQSKEETWYVMVELIIGLLACLGNTVVIWAVKLNHRLREPTFYFIVSLAVADIAVGAVVIPLAVVINFGLQTHFYSCLFLVCILLVLTQSSIMSLLAIAIDRYLRVKIAKRYKSIATRQRVWIAIGLCWAISVVLGFLPMFGWHSKEELQGTNTSCLVNCTFLAVVSMSYMVYLNFASVLAPLLIMVVLYLEIFYRIKKHLKVSVASSGESNKDYRKEQKLAKSVTLVLFMFAGCWLPLHIVNCIIYYNKITDVPRYIILIGISLTHSNSAINPFIYALRIGKIQEPLLYIWKKYFLFKDNSSQTPEDKEEVASKAGASQTECPFDESGDRPKTGPAMTCHPVPKLAALLHSMLPR
ncbi:adenosine receptor A3-like isoform X1 [Polypterus senegalus]|uniref:adenosine receptor A3-like isoform X1 n=1 Tax=Polypterus senegalus TaxID=55291 RepID=UPI001962DE9C|nr:adenosine receptor A3-like isoform X1 [Polypterus senegalus]